MAVRDLKVAGERIKAALDAAKAKGVDITNIKKSDEVYQYITGMKVVDQNGKKLNIQQKFALGGLDRAPKVASDVKKHLIDEIEKYLADGGDLHADRKKLPFYEALRTYQRKLKREGLNLTGDQIMKSLGYKNYSDLYKLWGEITNISQFRDENGFVDSYRKDKPLDQKIKDFAHAFDFPIALVSQLVLDENLKTCSLKIDYLGYVKEQLQDYLNKHGTLNGFKNIDPALANKFYMLRKYMLSDVGEAISSEDILNLLDINSDVFDTKAPKTSIKLEEIMHKYSNIAKDQAGKLRKKDITNADYYAIIRSVVSMGVTTKAFFKFYDIDYVDGLNASRLQKIEVKHYPYLEEMRARKKELVAEKKLSQDSCKEEIFEANLEASLQAYDEFKEKIYAKYPIIIEEDKKEL